MLWSTRSVIWRLLLPVLLAVTQRKKKENICQYLEPFKLFFFFFFKLSNTPLKVKSNRQKPVVYLFIFCFLFAIFFLWKNIGSLLLLDACSHLDGLTAKTCGSIGLALQWFYFQKPVVLPRYSRFCAQYKQTSECWNNSEWEKGIQSAIVKKARYPKKSGMENILMFS